jgi:hypothetical protein
MYTCKNSVYANSINKNTSTSSSSMYLSHRKKIFTPHNLLCQTPKQQGVALKHNSYDRRLTRIKALHLFPDYCVPPPKIIYKTVKSDNNNLYVDDQLDANINIPLGYTLSLSIESVQPVKIWFSNSMGVRNELTTANSDYIISANNTEGVSNGTILFTPKTEDILTNYFYEYAFAADGAEFDAALGKRNISITS